MSVAESANPIKSVDKALIINFCGQYPPKQSDPITHSGNSIPQLFHCALSGLNSVFSKSYGLPGGGPFRLPRPGGPICFIRSNIT